VLVDASALRAQVQQKYREVALEPGAQFHLGAALLEGRSKLDPQL
jgi:hypothetical protein